MNRGFETIRRGISLTPVKFGISFTMTHYNQASALVHVYTDGSIHLNHGGTEMGQGLFIKVAQVVADEFSVPLESVKITETNTSRVPNTSATAASSGSDINGKAAQNAALKIKKRLTKVAAEMFDVHEDSVYFKRQTGHSRKTVDHICRPRRTCQSSTRSTVCDWILSNSEK